MANKIFLILLAFVICLSCSNNKQNSNKYVDNDKFDVKLWNDSIIFSNVSESTDVSISLSDSESVQETISSTTSIDVLDLLRSNVKDKRKFALNILDNDLCIPLRVVSSKVDTTLNFYFTINEEVSYGKSCIKGLCARLVRSENNPENEVNLRRWLYRQDKYLPDSTFAKFAAIVSDLNKSDKNEYLTNDAIPILKSLSNVNYSVSTDIKADYYVLFAASNQQELDELIEDVVANNFDLTSTSASAIRKCHCQRDSDGYKCIFLVAINKDWSKTVVPLGLVAIDNTAPEYLTIGEGAINHKFLSFSNNIVVSLPQDCPPIFGKCSVMIVDWDGNGVECNVSFNIYFSGDVSKVVIHRRGDLATWTTGKDFVFDLTGERSPYSTSIKMHFSDGDNFIPITIYDRQGNTCETKIKQNARFERTSSSVINIDNNINF